MTVCSKRRRRGRIGDIPLALLGPCRGRAALSLRAKRPIVATPLDARSAVADGGVRIEIGETGRGELSPAARLPRPFLAIFR